MLFRSAHIICQHPSAETTWCQSGLPPSLVAADHQVPHPEEGEEEGASLSLH